jgi:hypothetical protein
LLVTTGVIFSYWSNLAKGKGKWQRRKAPAAMMRLKTRRAAAVQISTLLDERRHIGALFADQSAPLVTQQSLTDDREFIFIVALEMSACFP